MIKMMRVFFMLIIINSGCGSEPNPEPDTNQKAQGQDTATQESQSSFAVTSSSDLPACEDKRRGQLYYIESENLFKVCKTSGWTTIDVKGKDGVNGKDGTNAAISIKSVMGCSKIAGQKFSYDVTTFSNNMLYVSCSVAGGVVEITNAAFFDAQQAGSASGACLLTYDIDQTASSGFWYFTLNPRQAQYNDPGSQYDKQVVRFEDSNCKIYTPPSQ